MAIAAAGTGAPVAYAGPGDCGAGGAVIVAGTNAPRNADGLPTGGVTGVGERYTKQGYRVQYVDYPTDLWPLGPTPYDEDVTLGKAATERAVAGYQRRCPGKPVVIAGYSQGARIAGDVLSESGNRRGRSAVSADGLSGELYSDPRRDGNADGRGIENVLVGIMPGLTMSGPRPGGFGTVPVTQYCLQGDPICDLPTPAARPLSALDGIAGYFTKHGYYPARMAAPVHDDSAWHCAPQAAGSTADCVVPASPATVQVVHDELDPGLVAAGLPAVPRVVEPVLGALRSSAQLPDVLPDSLVDHLVPAETGVPADSAVPVDFAALVEPGASRESLSARAPAPMRELLADAGSALEAGRRAAPAEVPFAEV